MKSWIVSASIVLLALRLSVSLGQDKAGDASTKKVAAPTSSVNQSTPSESLLAIDPEPSPSLETSEKKTNPSANTEAPEVPSLPDEPTRGRQASQRDAMARSTPFRARMYVIEVDWSQATNREQALEDAKVALQESKLSVNRESDFLKKAPEILFGPTGVSYYSHDHAKSLIQWMIDHGVIKTMIESSLGEIKMNERVVSGRGLQKRSLPLSMQPGAVGLVIRDHTDAIPIMPMSELNRGELTFRTFRQVWWLQVNVQDGLPVNPTLDSKLFFEKKADPQDANSADATKPMSMEQDSPIDYIDLPRNEVAFFNAFSIPQQKENPDSFRRASERYEYAKRKGVLAVIAISQGQEATAVKPELRLPDRLEMIQHDWGTISSTIQLSPIELPSIPAGYESKLRSSNTENTAAPTVPSSSPQAEHSSSRPTGNPEFVKNKLETMRKRYLEAEARTIALTQKQMTEPVDAEVFGKALSDAFELRQEVHRLELGQLRGRMEALEQKIRTRDVHKNEILEARAKELMKLAKEWHSSIKMSDIDLGFHEAPGETNEKKFNVRRRQRQMTEILQGQPDRPAPDLVEKAGTVIDMSDKKQWAKPSKAPAPISVEEQIELKKKRSVDNLQELMRSLLDYEKDHGRLPPAVIERTIDGKGTVRHSWRVEILPYLGRKELYDTYKMHEPWDSPNNMSVLEQMPDVFASPLDSPDSTNTSYFAIITPGLKHQLIKSSPESSEDSFRPPLVGQNVIFHYANGTVFSDPKGTRLTAITDGPQRTIALFEFKQNVPWTQPLDIDIEMDPIFGKEGRWYNDGWHVAFVDGNVRQLSIENSPDDIKSLLRINDNDQIEPKVIVRRIRRRPTPNLQSMPAADSPRQSYDPDSP